MSVHRWVSAFRKKFRASIQRAGITQARAAELLGVALSTVEDWVSKSPRAGEPHRLTQIGIFSVMRMAGRGAATSDYKPRMLAQLGAVPDTELAHRYGVSATSVRRLREARGIAPPGRTGNRATWDEHAIAMLGTMPDKEIAARLGVNSGAVCYKRRRLGIPRFSRKGHTAND